MSKNELARKDTYPVTLSTAHLLYPTYCVAAQGLDPFSERIASVILTGAPGGGADPARNAVYLAQSGVVKSAIDEALRDDQQLVEAVEAARAHTDRLTEHFDEARAIQRRKEQLKESVRPLGRKELSIPDIFATHTEYQAAEAIAEKNGDLEHRNPTKPGLPIKILGIVASLFEVAGLWWLVFNPTDAMSYLLFLLGAATFIGVNHFGLPIVGRMLRAYRDLADGRRKAHTIAASAITTTEIDL